MLWMSYFLVSITVIGLTLACALYAPFYLLGNVWPPARRFAEDILQKGIWFLLKVQPWLDLDVKMPAELSAEIRELKGKLLIANHRSHLDVFLFLANIPGVRIMAKSSLFNIPFLGIFMRSTRQIPVIRGDMNSYLRALEQVKKYLRAGEIVLIFPEMTRAAADFKGLQEFRLAPFKMAKEAGATLVPVAISGSEKIWPPGQVKLNPGSVTLTFLPEIKSDLFAKSEDLSGALRSSLLSGLS